MLGTNERRCAWRGIALLAALLFAAPVLAEDEEALALARRGVESLPHDSFRARTRLVNATGAVRELEVQHKMVEGAHASYMEVASPKDLQGLRFLFLERPGTAPIQYVKVAAAKRHVLISETGREQPFLDSTFYIIDVVHPELNAYSYTSIGEIEVLGRRCKVVEGTPRAPETEVYGKQRVALDVESGVPLRREFFDRKGNLFKVWTVEKLEKIDGHWTQLEQRMTNVREGAESTIEVLKIEYGVSLPDEAFKPEYLLR